MFNKKSRDENKETAKYKKTKEETQHINDVTYYQQLAEQGNRALQVPYWEDERLAYKGDQWDTSIAPIARLDKKGRPNSVSNFILPTSMNIVDGLTTSVPEASISGRENSDDEMAAKLADLIAYIFERNNFHDEFKEIVEQGIKYGCFIGKVIWDASYVGGSGPNKYVGEIITAFQDKDEIYFDPAIINLKKRLQECEFINIKYRKKISWIKDAWENGKYVIEDSPDDDLDTTEGADPKQATVIECWHKGKPAFISEEQKKMLLDKSEKMKKEDKQRSEMYADMAEGKINGIHCSYVCGTVLLDYIPYVYEDGLYPFVFRTLYKDETNPWGFGEIRNILNPQVMYNTMFDIMLEAMSLQGLGGYIVEKGAMSEAQTREYKAKMYKGGELIEVNSKDKMKERTGVIVPQGIIEAMNILKTVIDTVSQNTAIQQGISPGANVPYASIEALGNKSDVRNKGKTEILQGFMTEYVRLIISRLAQFYTDEREYRIRGNRSMAIKKLVYEGLQQIVAMPDKNERLAGLIQLANIFETMDPKAADKYGKFKNTDMMKANVLEDGTKEMYVPDFDISVNIADERPQSWKYYEQLALSLFGKGMGPKAFWDTIIDGKLPDKETILKELQDMQVAAQQGAEQPQVDSKDLKNVQKTVK
jgi:hypothetical protein